MERHQFKALSLSYSLAAVFLLLFSGAIALAQSPSKKEGPPPVPVRVAPVEQRMVSDQISLIGTTEPITESTVAAEVSGVIEDFPVREGDFVKKGALLVRLKDTELRLRLKSVVASREKLRADLQNAKKELDRVSKLKDTNSIAQQEYDVALYAHRALLQSFLQSEAEIDYLNYEIEQKKVYAPFVGFVSKEHTQIGEWIKTGGPVVTLLDLSQIRITADVPERYAMMLSSRSKVRIVVKSISDDRLTGEIQAMLPQGNPDSRTFPVKISLANPGLKIKSGMEAMVTFDLTEKKEALLVSKDAVVTAGNNRMVFAVNDGKALPVMVKILGYYDGHVAVEGNLKAGDRVVVRGNERLRPGQPVQIQAESNES
jgi:RND family efflux transporter MFP subunit